MHSSKDPNSELTIGTYEMMMADQIFLFFQIIEKSNGTDLWHFKSHRLKTTMRFVAVKLSKRKEGATAPSNATLVPVAKINFKKF